MKSLFTLFICIIVMNTASAQQQSKDLRYKKYAGRYGNTSGISLFEDGTFLLYGYATGVFGRYHFEKDYLLFYPDQQELFEVFAHQNPALGDSTRMNFIGFESGSKTFAQFNQDSLQQVFNDDANCFNGPFIHQKVGKTNNLILSSLPAANAKPSAAANTSWHYGNKSGYNDFILIHNPPKREYENFSAMLSSEAGAELIKLSNYGGDKGYRKQKPDQEEQAQWKEFLEWKSQYDQSKGIQKNQLYANKQGKIFHEIVNSKYHYEAKTNQYRAIQDQTNDADDPQNQYNDPRYLRKYGKLQPETKNKFEGIKAAQKSIFFSVCEKDTE